MEVPRRKISNHQPFSVYSMERRRKNRTVADVNAINTVAAKAEDSTENEEEFVKYGAVDEFYDLGKEIGRGSYGTVKTCIQKSTRDVYAVKMVKTSNHTVRKNVLREIEIMRALGSHSRLVALRDAYQTPFEISMVLEFVPGGELFERIVAEEFLMEDDAIDYVGQILEALQFMHRKNIVHLDLKPENILCVSMDSHDVKLVDFGLARDLDSEEEVKSSFGTPDFVAPEVIRMKPVSCASDLWSLGVVTYVLLSGLMPFSGDDDHQTLIKVAKADWDFDDDCFDDLSQDAKDFIEGLLVKEPSERLTIEECFSHPWIKDAKDTVVKIHTQKHKAFMAKRRWKKSVNALLAVRRMSLSPLFSRNRRSSMDPSILKSSSEADEEQQNGDRKALSPLGTLDLNDQAHHPMSRSCFDLNAKTIRALQKKADEAMSKDGKRGEEDTAEKGRLKGVTISCSDECENDGSRGEPSSLKDPDSCSRRRASTVSGTTSRRQRKIPEVSINVGSPTKKDFEPVTFTFDTNELKQNDKKVSATFTIKETQVTERGTSDKGSCKSPRNSFRFRNDLASSTKVQQPPNCVFKPQKLTFQLEKCQVKDGTGNLENGQNEAIPTICVNDEVCPVSPPSVTLNNNVEKLDRRQMEVPTLQLSSTKNVATVNFKPDGVQSITVKLDDINNALQFPANQVTCHVPRRSTGSSIGSSGLHRP